MHVEPRSPIITAAILLSGKTLMFMTMRKKTENIMHASTMATFIINKILNKNYQKRMNVKELTKYQKYEDRVGNDNFEIALLAPHILDKV